MLDLQFALDIVQGLQHSQGFVPVCGSAEAVGHICEPNVLRKDARLVVHRRTSHTPRRPGSCIAPSSVWPQLGGAMAHAAYFLQVRGRYRHSRKRLPTRLCGGVGAKLGQAPHGHRSHPLASSPCRDTHVSGSYSAVTSTLFRPWASDIRRMASPPHQAPPGGACGCRRRWSRLIRQDFVFETGSPSSYEGGTSINKHWSPDGAWPRSRVSR